MSNKVSFLYVAQDRYSKVTEKINRASIKLRNTFKSLHQTENKLARASQVNAGIIGGGFKRMLGSITAFFGAREFLQRGGGFQDAMADLSAITGATGKDLDKLRRGAFTLGKDASTSGASVAEAFKLVASEKPELLSNIAALQATTKEVLLLKNAAGIDLATSAKFTAQGLNIFGKGAEDANKFVNILAAGAKLGSSEIAQTGEAMLIAGPAARAAGLSFVQLNAAIQTVAKGGIKSARAGTALNAIFGRLRRLGFDFQKLGLQGAFEAVKAKLDKVTDSTKRAQMEQKIFGEEHAKVGLALLDNVAFLGQYEKSLAGTNIAQEQADIRLGTFNARMRRLGVIIEEKMIRVFNRLAPTIEKQAVLLGNFLDSLDSGQIDGFVESLKILLWAAEKIATAFKIVLAVLKGVGTAIGELAAQIATANFDEKLSTSFKDAFSIGGKVLGVFGGDKEKINVGGKSRTDVNVNLNAPEGSVESVKSKTVGNVSGLNLGVNMVTQ